MNAADVQLRLASLTDAVTISALSVQVFLDTYATEGVRPDLAREAFTQYSVEAFSRRLGEAQRKFVLAEANNGLLGFAEIVVFDAPAPSGTLSGAELVRLYVQPASHGRGIGRALLSHAEQLAVAASLPAMWLTVWDGNLKALGFYFHIGYAEVGHTTYSFQGSTYANRVIVKHLVRS